MIRYEARPYGEQTEVEAIDGPCAGQSMVVSCSFERFEEAHKQVEAGAMTQDAFHFLDVGEREFLISGITPEKWAQWFG